jgi:hypothetical protein
VAAALFAAPAVATAALTTAGTAVATALTTAGTAVATALTTVGTAVTGATVTGSAAALTAAAFATATAALTAAGPTSGVLLVAATAGAATVSATAVSAATLTATAVPAAVTALAAVVDAAVPEVTGVAAALATEATAVTPGVAEPAEVATGSGTAVTETGAAVTETAITEPAQTAIGTASTEAAVAEPSETAAGTAGTEPAEAVQAAVGAALGTPTDMLPEPAEVRPVLVPEPPEVSELTELTESAAHLDRRLLDQPPAEQAPGAGGGDVEAAGALVAVSGKGRVGRVADGGVVTGHVVGRDVRNVVVCKRVCRAPEEQGRLGQPRVECGRSPGGTGLDAEGTELADLRGCQAESSGHLLGVTVEFGPEGRVDGKAGHGIAKGVVGHVLGSPWVCVGLRWSACASA